MRRPVRLLILLSGAAVLAANATAQPASRPLGVAATSTRASGYLRPETVPDGYRILPPVPQDGSPAKAEDLAAFQETRALKDTPRWLLAQRDAVQTPRSLLDDFACGLGARLDEVNAPVLMRLFARVRVDASNATNKAKDQFARLRPFVGTTAPICTEPSREGLAQSRSYPSGHATLGWAYALILAELAPDRATPLLARARVYGESRVVCGVHWVSDIEEGRALGSALVSVLHADPAFAADLAAARQEAAAARAAGAAALASAQCTLDGGAAAQTPWRR